MKSKRKVVENKVQRTTTPARHLELPREGKGTVGRAVEENRQLF